MEETENSAWYTNLSVAGGGKGAAGAGDGDAAAEAEVVEEVSFFPS